MIYRRTLIASGISAVLARMVSAEVPPVTSGHVGQLVVTGFRGTTASDPDVEIVRNLLERGSIGGVILLRRNITSPDQLRRLTDALRASSETTPIISIDQEGGKVTRVGSYNGFSDWTSAAALARSGRSNAEILAYYRARATELSLSGINLNYGPVVDLNVNPSNPIIGALGRSYGERVDQVVRFAELFIHAHRDAGIKTCLKHFPGHGSSHTDSHRGSVDISQTWSSREIAPFEALVKAGLADTIMNAHVLHRHLSDQPWVPTSLSSNSARELREGFKFRGPIITDDMQMGAILSLSSAESAAVQAVRAGSSFLIYSNHDRRYGMGTTELVLKGLASAVEMRTLPTHIVQTAIDVATRFRFTL